MRLLVLLRGAPGVGKSHWIYENNLQEYTLCADNLRLLYQSPVLNVKGLPEISQKNDHKVWDLLFQLLEERMSRGETTIIDATHSRSATIGRYKHLCQEYRYRCVVVDFSDIPLETILEQNKTRPAYKFVPEDAVKSIYARIKTQQVPNWTTKVSYKNFSPEAVGFKLYDFSQFKKVYHIGDIHGSFTVLKKFFDENPLDPEGMYIFTGDYLDRGTKNVETLRFLMELQANKNVLFLEGNHEIHLRNFAHGRNVTSKEFNFVTGPELINAEINRSEIREFARKLAQIAYYKFEEKRIFVNHAGYPALPQFTTSLQSLIKGVGSYTDIEKITETFNEDYEGSNVFQIHGHRNVGMLPIRNGNVFNLEGEVEFGGYLRVVELSKDGFKEIEIKNDDFSEKDAERQQVEITVSASDDLVSTLRSNRFVRETKITDSISSFNFTREAFMKGKWDEQNVKARGLFINVETGDIVSRSYNKFFNLGEREETDMNSLRKNLQFPVSVYQKENGYLGLVGYDKQTDEVIFSTKSVTTGDYVNWFIDILKRYKIYSAVSQYVREHNVTMVFEVIDQEHDPHIIEYLNGKLVVLLDIVYNDINYRKYSYEEMSKVAGSLGILFHKIRVCILNDWYEFLEWYDGVSKFKDNDVEGYVIEDGKGFMVKIKTPYYQTWKLLRKIKETVERNRQVHTEWLSTDVQNYFYAFLKTLTTEQLANKSIIELRNMYNEQTSANK